jgi:hypothetical protein
MAGCGRGRVIAHPASADFCSSQVKLTTPSCPVFINQDVVEAATDVVGKTGIANRLSPVEQEVVVIEHVLALLRFDVSCEQLLQFGLPGGAPGKLVPSTSSTASSALMQRE